MTLAAGRRVANIKVVVKGDITPEADEQFVVHLKSTDRPEVVLGRADGEVTILDDDGDSSVAGTASLGDGTGDDGTGDDGIDATVSIGDVTLVEGNGGTRSLLVPVTLSEPRPTDVKVTYVTAPGSATAPSDFKARSAKVTVRAGMVWGTATIPTLGDDDPEPDETFTTTLADTTDPAVAIGRAIGTVTLLDDDTPRLRPPAPPGMPIAQAVTTAGAVGQFDVSWSASSDSGTSPITAYDVEVTRDGSTWVSAGSTEGTTTHRHSCGLPVVTCAYRVSALNDVGARFRRRRACR